MLGQFIGMGFDGGHAESGLAVVDIDFSFEASQVCFCTFFDVIFCADDIDFDIGQIISARRNQDDGSLDGFFGNGFIFFFGSRFGFAAFLSRSSFVGGNTGFGRWFWT